MALTNRLLNWKERGHLILVQGNRLNMIVDTNGNGNLTQYGAWRYYYDCENRLVDVNYASGQTEYRRMHYDYDYLGRRVKKIVYGSPVVTTMYCYDGDRVIADYNESGVLQRKYVYGPGIDEPICMIAGGNTYYYHFDGLGSVVALSNNSGQVVERYSYNVFGEPNRTSSINNPYFFTGRQYDSETGNYYYRARYYSPKLGRFLQTDPIGYYDSMNLYQYCLNNPLNWVDPWGLCRSGPDYAEMTAAEKAWELTKAAARGAAEGAAAWADGFIPFADPFSGSYNNNDPTLGFSKAMGGVSRDALIAAAGLKAGGIGSKIANHGPYHNFPGLGNRPHVQINVWRNGVPGSGRTVRIPY